MTNYLRDIVTCRPGVRNVALGAMVRWGVIAIAGMLSATGATAPRLVLRDIDVIPMTSDTVIHHRTVIIDHEVIFSIHPFAPAEIFPGAQVIDGRGKYVMPGMVEMHAHLPYGHPTQPSQRTYFAQCLAAGVTGIRSMRGRPEHLALRDSVRRGEILAPDLFLSELLPTRDSGWDGAKLREFIAQTKKEGWDFVKYLGGISPALCDSAVKICDELGMRIAGHSLNRNLRRSVDARFASIEHYQDFVALYKSDSAAYEQLIADMIARSISFCPTLAWYYVNGFHWTDQQMFSSNGMNHVAPALLAVWRDDWENDKRDATKDTAKFRERLSTSTADLLLFNRLLKRFVDAGGKLLCGPEPSEFLVPGFCMAEELKLFCAAGLTPFQALKSATTEPAAFFSQSASWGTVEKGKRANLVVMKTNPLENIENVQSVAGTIKGGKYYSQEELLKMGE